MARNMVPTYLHFRILEFPLNGSVRISSQEAKSEEELTI